MERGQLGIENRPCTVYVFEELIAHLEHPRTEKAALRLHKWETALDAWTFSVRVCDHMTALMGRHGTPIDVLTWRPIGFANALHDRLWYLDVPVRETKSATYPSASQHFATDPEVTLVYDADPAHRWGYGYKGREFSIGRF